MQYLVHAHVKRCHRFIHQSSHKALTDVLLARRAVELIRREILRQHPEAAATGVNAVLIDFLLYDLAKERESAGESSLFHARQSVRLV